MKRTRFMGAFAATALALTTFAAAGQAAPLDADKGAKKPVKPVAADVTTSPNVQHLVNVPAPSTFAGGTGTDIAFSGNKAFVGDYAGFTIYDISTPATPKTLATVLCPGAQNDVTVSGNLLYLSTDTSRSDASCTSRSQSETIKSSWEGIKVFDVSDPTNPKYVAAVETACGSHTNTLVPGATSDFIYVSSFFPSSSYPDCQPPHDLISVVEVPKANPAAAALVAAPNVFPSGFHSSTSGCHDITAYPSRKIAAGACMGDGVIFDISDPKAPKVIEHVQDTTNFAFWHSATFNNTGTKVVFTDELGGGGSATCNASTGPNRGANGIYDLSADNQLTFRSYYKIPRYQTSTENCVAHNGSLIPVEGRDIMVQSWYQGGTSFWDFTDSANPREIGYADRPAIAGGGLGGTWSSYYYNGHVYSSDLTRGLDVYKITDPDLAPADSIVMDEYNPQSQPVFATQ